jgi:hypothetical protein
MNILTIESLIIEFSKRLENISAEAKIVNETSLNCHDKVRVLLASHEQIMHVLQDLLRLYATGDPILSALLDQRIFEFEMADLLYDNCIKV